jgi:hypothetical protein
MCCMCTIIALYLVSLLVFDARSRAYFYAFTWLLVLAACAAFERVPSPPSSI